MVTAFESIFIKILKTAKAEFVRTRQCSYIYFDTTPFIVVESETVLSLVFQFR